MRIRKRDVPLPLSSLSPIPLSDPLFLGRNHHPPVQLPLLPTAKPPPPPPVFDSPPQHVPRPIPSSINDPDRLPKEELAADYSPELRVGKERVVVSEKSSNYNQSRDPDNAQKSTYGSSPPAYSPSLSREAHTTALKKRRLSSSGEVDGDENKMETKTKASSNGGRRRGRGGGVGGGGGASMEGSRCSRVNGRGWRCGQQTLVGYSLCEHHLGKGRLRSMTNVRSRSMIGTREASGKGYEKLEAINQLTGIDPERSLPSCLKEGNSLTYNNGGKDDDDDEEEEEEEDSTANGKKKARSMSSLLGQSSNHSNKGGVSTMSFVVERKDL